MLRVAVVDDEQYWLDNIGDNILKYSCNYEIEIVTEKFLSCENLLAQYLKNSKFDIIFLDIEFRNSENKTMSGIDFGKKFRDIYKDDNTAIVYITSYKEYAFDAIKIRPFNYLEKPVTFESISEVIGQCIDNFEKGKKIFKFMSGKVANGVIVSNIRYF